MSTLSDRTQAALGEGGALAADVPGFVPRAAQQRLAEAIAAAVPSTNGARNPGRSKYGRTLSIRTRPTRSVDCSAIPKSSRYCRHEEYDEYAEVATPSSRT